VVDLLLFMGREVCHVVLLIAIKASTKLTYYNRHSVREKENDGIIPPEGTSHNQAIPDCKCCECCERLHIQLLIVSYC